MKHTTTKTVTVPGPFAPEVEQRRAEYDNHATMLARVTENAAALASSPTAAEDLKAEIHSQMMSLVGQLGWDDPRIIREFYTAVRLWVDQQTHEREQARMGKVFTLKLEHLSFGRPAGTRVYARMSREILAGVLMGIVPRGETNGARVRIGFITRLDDCRAEMETERGSFVFVLNEYDLLALDFVPAPESITPQAKAA